MIALLQRASSASVSVEGEIIGRIGVGLVVLLCVERGDSERAADALLDRTLGLRIFPDQQGRMNRSLADLAGEIGPEPGPESGGDERAGLLLVPQFTLAADTRSGRRPSFTAAAPPEEGRRLFEYFVGLAADRHPGRVATGRFGAMMAVALVNDGPVTLWLREVPAP